MSKALGTTPQREEGRHTLRDLSQLVSVGNIGQKYKFSVFCRFPVTLPDGLPKQVSLPCWLACAAQTLTRYVLDMFQSTR
jgi:hypothetical protein